MPMDTLNHSFERNWLLLQELEELIDLSIKFKQLKKEGIPHKYLDGLNIAFTFENIHKNCPALQWLVRT